MRPKMLVTSRTVDEISVVAQNPGRWVNERNRDFSPLMLLTPALQGLPRGDDRGVIRER
jgi:hypothetical protein